MFSVSLADVCFVPLVHSLLRDAGVNEPQPDGEGLSGVQPWTNGWAIRQEGPQMGHLQRAWRVIWTLQDSQDLDTVGRLERRDQERVVRGQEACMSQQW